LCGLEYNSLLLRAQASVFPKIILLDKNIHSKLSDGVISLNIIHNEQEVEYAQKIKKLMDEKYKNSIGSYKFVVNLTNIETTKKIKDATAYYFFNLLEDEKKKVLLDAKNKNKICFGYNDKDFDNDILISLLLKEKTYIYLNKSSLHEYNIKFIPIFYKIIKVK